MQTTLRFPHHILLIALLLGIGADQLLYGRWLGISLPLLVAVFLLALSWLRRGEQLQATAANRWIAGAALFFAALIAVRDAPALIFFNVAAMLGLLIVYIASYRTRSIWKLSAFDLLLRPISAAVMAGIAPGPLLADGVRKLPLKRGNLTVALPFVRGAALAVPAVLCFAGLLAAADGIFASYLRDIVSIPFDISTMAIHSIFVVICSWGVAGGLKVALTPPITDAEPPVVGDTQRLVQPPSWRWLGSVEALTVLFAVDLLFCAFMAIQGAYFFGGLDTLARTDMTFADYARRGFFELVTVACLALAMLCGLMLSTKRESKRQIYSFNIACVLMVALVVGMLVSAFYRMWLYEEAYGFTELRLYTHSFMVFLAVVLILFVIALLRERAQIFLLGSGIAAIVTVGALNIADPHTLIVRQNVARYTETSKIDSEYLAELSADATPELVKILPLLPSAEQQPIREMLKWQRADLAEAAKSQGWPAWSFARWRALATLEQAGIELPIPGESRW